MPINQALTNKTRRRVRMQGRVTSVRMEDAFWQTLEDIAAAQHLKLPALINQIDGHKNGSDTLTSSLRVYCLLHYHDVKLPSRRGRSPSGRAA